MHSQSEKQVSQLSERMKGREEICSNLQQKVAFHFNYSRYPASFLFIANLANLKLISSKGQRVRDQAYRTTAVRICIFPAEG